MRQVTAKSLQEALDQIVQETGCTVEQIHYTILEEKKGLLSLGSQITIEAYTNDDIKEFLFDYLGNYFTNIDQNIEVAIEERNDEFTVNLNGDNNAILIGKMGRTLAAFNTLVRAAVNAEFKRRIDVLIDINHYKENRYHHLRGMAKRIARQVLKSKVMVELDPMPSDERKVIHKVLTNWDNIKTESIGEGANRHLTIQYQETPIEDMSFESEDEWEEETF